MEKGDWFHVHWTMDSDDFHQVKTRFFTTAEALFTTLVAAGAPWAKITDDHGKVIKLH